MLKEYYGAEPDTTNLRVIVASVPDPIDTRAAYKFDEVLEAMQEGAQDSGYVMDRFYLPWPRIRTSYGEDPKIKSTPAIHFAGSRVRANPNTVHLTKSF